MSYRATLTKEEDPKVCPRCNGELVSIEGQIVRWLTCTSCRWKKLIEKEEKVVKITRIGESHKDAVPKAPEKLRVSFDQE